jgi:hypothetical protein
MKNAASGGTGRLVMCFVVNTESPAIHRGSNHATVNRVQRFSSDTIGTSAQVQATGCPQLARAILP